MGYVWNDSARYDVSLDVRTQDACCAECLARQTPGAQCMRFQVGPSGPCLLFYSTGPSIAVPGPALSNISIIANPPGELAAGHAVCTAASP